MVANPGTLSVDAAHWFPAQDPWQNLAREERRLDLLAPGQSELTLYVNRPCVVLGRHQNPLREVRFDEVVRRRLPLVRRPSGGGTVYHDLGNLNWGWLGPKADYDRQRIGRTVARALATLGRDLEVTAQGDLFWQGRKVSGSASLVRQDRVLHHGTLLCRARLDDLRGVLGPTGVLTAWVGVASRPASVANLDLDVNPVAEALVLAFRAGTPGWGDGQTGPAAEAGIVARALDLAGPAWRWDQTPPFTWRGPTRHGELTVAVRDGLIAGFGDDRTGILGNMLGMRFFDSRFLGDLPIGEVP